MRQRRPAQSSPRRSPFKRTCLLFACVGRVRFPFHTYAPPNSAQEHAEGRPRSRRASQSPVDGNSSDSSLEDVARAFPHLFPGHPGVRSSDNIMRERPASAAVAGRGAEGEEGGAYRQFITSVAPPTLPPAVAYPGASSRIHEWHDFARVCVERGRLFLIAGNVNVVTFAPLALTAGSRPSSRHTSVASLEPLPAPSAPALSRTPVPVVIVEAGASPPRSPLRRPLPVALLPSCVLDEVQTAEAAWLTERIHTAQKQVNRSIR